MEVCYIYPKRFMVVKKAGCFFERGYDMDVVCERPPFVLAINVQTETAVNVICFIPMYQNLLYFSQTNNNLFN